MKEKEDSFVKDVVKLIKDCEKFLGAKASQVLEP